MKRFLPTLMWVTGFIASWSSQAFSSQNHHLSEKKDLHILMIDACFIPKDVDFLKGKNVSIELITSAHPALEVLFTPEICIRKYRNAVGSSGKVAAFNAKFIGTKMADPNKVNKLLDKISAKRGAIDFVLSNSSDQASYIAHFVRLHLNQKTKWLDIRVPENFYDKYVMKQNLVRNAPQVKTSHFVGFDASKKEIEDFFGIVNFPQEWIILKKRRSAGSVGIKIIKDMKEYNKIAKSISDKENYLIEKFIHGKIFRIAGEKINGELKVMIPSLNLTTPFEHYRGGKPRATTIIDEQVIPRQKLWDFTDRVLKGLEMVSGTYHLEGIWSDADQELYFMEIGARVGEGNMDDVHQEVYGYQSKRTFFFKQFPDGYFEEPAEKELYTELIDKPLKTSETVFTVLTYPFKDANDYTFQNVQSNMTLALKNGDPEFPSLVGCDFDESFDQFTDKQWKKLQSKKGKSFSRYAFQACLKAIACRFEGDRGQVEADLKGFQKKYYFVAKPSKSLRNSLVPRSLLMAGGL